MSKIIALTDAGLRLAQQLSDQLDDTEIWFKPKPFADAVQQAFREGEPLVFICAIGIVVRTLAPAIRDKYQDPPVLVLDEQGQYVIPLLSGHEGGANHWAAEVAQLLSAQPVITTAKPYLQPVYAVGMGCERHCPMDELERLLMACLDQAGLTLDAVFSINSIDIKADEVGLIELAEKLGKPFQTWNVPQLSTMESLLSTRSEYVFNTVGVYGVAESAALYAVQVQTGAPPELVLNKQKTKKATCAIARSYPVVDTEN